MELGNGKRNYEGPKMNGNIPKINDRIKFRIINKLYIDEIHFVFLILLLLN